jgi:hypothetical protein
MNQKNGLNVLIGLLILFLNKQQYVEKNPKRIFIIIFSFLIKIRPTKRKTMDRSNDHKRTKSSLTLEEKFKQIDRTKFDVFEYGKQLLHLISDENNKSLPTFEQLQLLEYNIFRFYWTSNQEKTWSQILDILSDIFENEPSENFRNSYSKILLEMNINEQKEIERLLQITL